MRNGFTLSELLVSVMILGVIATFTIPKVLMAQQNSLNRAITKEAAGAISESFQLLKLNGGVNASTSSNDITPFINYIRVQTTGSIDGRPGNASANCGTFTPCLVLAHGSILRTSSVSYNGTATTNAIEFLFDPDGKNLGSTQSKAIQFFIYLNGRLATRADTLPSTTNSTGNTYDPDPTLDPVWFSW